MLLVMAAMWRQVRPSGLEELMAESKSLLLLNRYFTASAQQLQRMCSQIRVFKRNPRGLLSTCCMVNRTVYGRVKFDGVGSSGRPFGKVPKMGWGSVLDF